MLNQIAIGIIIFFKYAIPVAIIFFPFADGWWNFVLDTIDGDILIPLGLSDTIYQPIDKIADWFTYVGMVFAASRLRWGIRRWIYILFGLRSIGQIAFFIFQDEKVFFLFPNFLEPLFLVYATIVVIKKTHAHAFYLQHRVVLWIFVILYKLQDEWLTHIGNVDRTEFFKRISQQ